MIFVGILAGGKGERVNRDLPKQFILICGKPLIYYSLNQFYFIDSIDKIIISCNKLYIDLVEDVINAHHFNNKMVVIEGGETRHQSLVNILKYIKTCDYKIDDKILIHEAARPLIEADIIYEHIKYLKNHEATNTLFSAVDTMITSMDGEFIYEVPPKKSIYHGQTPQGYHIGTLLYVIEHDVNENDLKNEVDLCSIYLRNNRKIKIVKGNEKLFKVTHPKDIYLLQFYINNIL